jgi:ribA/ribD-fused uncharacterized protein
MASTDIITFTKVKLSWGWLGNMSAYPVTHENVVWKTTEHLFQALRFTGDSPVRQEIAAIGSPMGAKMCAKKHAAEMVVTPRSEIDLDNMRLCLHLKLVAHTALQAILVSTGKALLVEDVSKRPRSESNLFWGMAQQNGQWVGHNWLGRLWMELRHDYQTKLAVARV